MSAHAILAPSGAPIWGHCSGTIAASEGRPDISGPEAEIGDAAHWVVSECLEAWKHVVPLGLLSAEEYVGQVAPNGLRITDDMAEGAQVMVDDVIDVAGKAFALQTLMVEHRVHAPQIHPENWGTLDAALWLPKGGHLYLWDYKNGHRENRAEGNLQLIDYVAGLVNELQLNGIADEHITLHLRIVQPFSYKAAGPVDEWIGKLSDLRGYFNQLSVKAHEALGPSPKLTTGLWCRDCPAVGDCLAARKAGYRLIDYANQPYAMDEMNGADLATERLILSDGIKAAAARLEAIEDDIRHRVQNGDTSTGLVLETTPGNLDWTVEPAVAVAFASQFGVDVSKAGAKTPTQTIAATPKEMRPAMQEAIKAVTRRKQGGLKLTNAGDTKASRAFAKG